MPVLRQRDEADANVNSSRPAPYDGPWTSRARDADLWMSRESRLPNELPRRCTAHTT